MDAKVKTTTAKKKLNLRRKTVHNLNDQLLTTQGWSLWTCDKIAYDAGPRPTDQKDGD